MSAMDERPEATASDAGGRRATRRSCSASSTTRPSGTRQRLAGALGKNRSFVSQIANPAYAMPIPARHLETIFEICHFSPDERRSFPRRLCAAPIRAACRSPQDDRRVRAHTIYLPDLGDDERNRELDRAVGDFVQRLTRLIGEATTDRVNAGGRP